MTKEEFEIVSDDICANSTSCKNCLLNEICKTVQNNVGRVFMTKDDGILNDYNTQGDLYPYFIKNIPIRANVRKWMVVHGYTASH